MTEEQRWPEPAYLTKDHAINMTLRDYFAAKAMQALTLRLASKEGLIVFDDAVAESAYLMADAMLKARGQA